MDELECEARTWDLDLVSEGLALYELCPLEQWPWHP